MLKRAWKSEQPQLSLKPKSSLDSDEDSEEDWGVFPDEPDDTPVVDVRPDKVWGSQINRPKWTSMRPNHHGSIMSLWSARCLFENWVMHLPLDPIHPVRRRRSP